MNFLGTFFLYLSLATGLISAALLSFAKREKGFREHPGIVAGLLSCSGIIISGILLLYFLVSGDFSIGYVYSHTDSSLPLMYKISAFWSGGEGSLLFWALILALLLIYLYLRHGESKDLKKVFQVMMIFMNAFLAAICIFSNPFRSIQAQSEGFGLNPALQSLGMIIHPPMIITAFSMLFVAFAYSYTGLNNRDRSSCKSECKKWGLAGWLLLTLGIATGAVWAYTELGWGGYWAWDPIENVSLVTWLISTAFLHLEHLPAGRGGEKRISFVYAALMVVSIIFGTFLARSGVLKSVHAYSDQNIFVYLVLLLIVIIAAISAIFIKYSINKRKQGFEVEKENKNSASEKELGLFNALKGDGRYLTVIILSLMGVLILSGTVFPLISKWVLGEAYLVPIGYYDIVTGVTGLLLVLVIGINPYKGLLNSVSMFWGAGKITATASNIPAKILIRVAAAAIIFLPVVASRGYGVMVQVSMLVCMVSIVNLFIFILINFQRVLEDRRILTTIIVHISIVLIAFGITGSRGMAIEHSQVLSKDESVKIGSYEVKYDRMQKTGQGEREISLIDLEVRGRNTVWHKSGSFTHYKIRDIYHSNAIILHSVKEDLCILLEGVTEEGRLNIKVMVLKWIQLVWLGVLLLLTGTVMRFKY